MMVIGVTGGVGTGKSTVARMFGKLGAKVLDADRLTHRLMQPGTQVYRRIRLAFGDRVLDPQGKINRRILGELAFRSSRRLRTLCRIIHPAVRQKIQQELSKIQVKDPNAHVVLDIPLLIEAGKSYPLDALVVVSSSLKAAVKRLKIRSGWSAQEVARRAGFQLPLRQKIKKADFVVRNDGSISETRRQVARILQRLVAQCS